MLPDPPVGIEDDSKSAGAPAKEIEITPEMIAAGESEIATYGPDGDGPSETVRAIFEAMMLVHHRRS